MTGRLLMNAALIASLLPAQAGAAGQAQAPEGQATDDVPLGH